MSSRQIIKEFLDLFREGKIKINFPELDMDVSAERGSYGSDEEILKEILDLYNYTVKHKVK